MTHLRLPFRFAESSILKIGSLDRNEPRAIQGKQPYLVDAIDERALCVKVASKSGAGYSSLGGFIVNPKRCFDW